MSEQEQHPAGTVTLEPHPAVKMIHGIAVRMINDQKQILVWEPRGETTVGVRVGYCGVEPNKPISFIRPYPPAFRELVAAEVERQLGGPPSMVSQPPERKEQLHDDEIDDDEPTDVMLADEELEYEGGDELVDPK